MYIVVFCLLYFTNITHIFVPMTRLEPRGMICLDMIHTVSMTVRFRRDRCPSRCMTQRIYTIGNGENVDDNHLYEWCHTYQDNKFMSNKLCTMSPLRPLKNHKLNEMVKSLYILNLNGPNPTDDYDTPNYDDVSMIYYTIPCISCESIKGTVLILLTDITRFNLRGEKPYTIYKYRYYSKGFYGFIHHDVVLQLSCFIYFSHNENTTEMHQERNPIPQWEGYCAGSHYNTLWTKDHLHDYIKRFISISNDDCSIPFYIRPIQGIEFLYDASRVYYMCSDNMIILIHQRYKLDARAVIEPTIGSPNYRSNSITSTVNDKCSDVYDPKVEFMSQIQCVSSSYNQASNNVSIPIVYICHDSNIYVKCFCTRTVYWLLRETCEMQVFVATTSKIQFFNHYGCNQLNVRPSEAILKTETGG